MRCLLVIILTLLISTVSGVIETSVKGVPRLNNSLYCDYYFTCHTEGETLQWIVGNNTLSNYFGNSTTGSVLTGSVSNCNFTATLLSLKLLSLSRSFKSALILTCQSNFDMFIICSDGFSLRTINIPEKELNLRAETYINSVYLEHVLSQNLVNEDNSTCTNVFVCGVNDRFMNVQLGDVTFGFTNFDSIGRERHEVQGTSVEQQAILIGNEPYNLVVAMFLVDSEITNVTCGSPPNITFLSSMECPVMPETTSTTESQSSTVGESSTMVKEGSINLPLILGLSIPFGVLLVVLWIIITIVPCCLYNKSRLKNNNNLVPDPIPLQIRPLNETDSGGEKETPLVGNNFSGIKNPKNMISDIEYDNFFTQVQYIFLTRNENTFNAATTILTAPDIEKTSNGQLTSIKENKNVYIGMIGPHPVCLVNEIDNCFVQTLQNVISKYFRNAKYLIFVGRCFGIDPKIMKFADFVISNNICLATEDQTNKEKHTKIEFIAPEIRSMFCFYPEKVKEFKVTSDRTAKPYVGIIATGVNILENKALRDFALTCCDGIYGYEETSRELLTLFTNGINMENNTTKHMQIITIGAVTGYVDGDTVNECEEWQFMASRAAFHYVASKMINPHPPGNISYEIKKTKQITDIDKYENFLKQIEYIVSSPHPDSFSAATTNLSAPNNEGRNDDIIQIDDFVYIGMIGSHSVGLLRFQNDLPKFQNMGNAILEYFPNAKYLIDVGGCICTNRQKADLGDVLISEEIVCCGENTKTSVNEITAEIKNIFGRPQDVEGLKLPGNRKAKHSLVRIMSPGDIGGDKHMKAMTKASPNTFAQEIVGGVLLEVKEMLKKNGKAIHVILINGVSCYADCEENTEWMFVATQAAFHYVRRKLEMQQKINTNGIFSHSPIKEEFSSPDSI